MVKKYIFKKEPNRKNFNCLKRYGFLELKGHRTLIKLKLSEHNQNRCSELNELLMKFLEKEGYFLLKTYNINRCGSHQKSYLENPTLKN